MDDDRFENFLRTLTASPSRRAMLRTLGALALGGGIATSIDEAEARKCPVCKKKKNGRCRKVKDGTACISSGGIDGKCVSGRCCTRQLCAECPDICPEFNECRTILGSGGVKTCCRPLRQTCDESGQCCLEASFTVSCRTIADKGTFGCGFAAPNTATRCCIPEGGRGSSGDCDCCGTAVNCEDRCISAACAGNCTKSCTSDADCGSGCFLTCQSAPEQGDPDKKRCLSA